MRTNSITPKITDEQLNEVKDKVKEEARSWYQGVAEDNVKLRQEVNSVKETLSQVHEQLQLIGDDYPFNELTDSTSYRVDKVLYGAFLKFLKENPAIVEEITKKPEFRKELDKRRQARQELEEDSR